MKRLSTTLALVASILATATLASSSLAQESNAPLRRPRASSGSAARAASSASGSC